MFTKWKILCSLFRMSDGDAMCYFGWGNLLPCCLAINMCKLTSLTCEWYLVLFTCCGQSKTGQWGEAWQQGYLQCVLASYQTSSNGNRIVSGPISNAVWIAVCQQVDCCFSNVNCVSNKTVVWCSVTQACPCFTSYSWTPSSTRQMFDHPGTSLSKQDTTAFISLSWHTLVHVHVQVAKAAPQTWG